MLQLEQGKLPEPISRVVSQLLEVLSSQQPRLHWRYELMASAILMFLLPPVDAPTAKVPDAHSIYLSLTQEFSHTPAENEFLLNC